MSSITVTLSEERLAQLREMAAQLQTTPEELARASIEDLLTRSEKAGKETEASLVRDWMMASTPALLEIWDNEEDAVYDEL